MTPEQQKRLTWEDATERFLDVAELKASDRPGVVETALDKLAWVAHNTLTGALTDTAPGVACLLATSSDRSAPKLLVVGVLHNTA